jgi:predicted methyltransferase
MKFSRVWLEIWKNVFKEFLFILKSEFPNFNYFFNPNLSRKSKDTRILIDIRDKVL